MTLDNLSPNKVFINMAALRNNFRETKRLAGSRRIMAIVKSDAYGHGLICSAQTLAQAGADALGVVTLGEAIDVKERGLGLPIHIMGELNEPAQMEKAVADGFSAFAADIDQIRAWSQKAAELYRTASIHIEVDTGLGRLGLHLEEVIPFLKELKSLPNLEILGLVTRLATAGDLGAHEQLRKFDEVCCQAAELGFRFPQDSALDSDGLIWHNNHQSSMVRVGLMLYGGYPGPKIGPQRPDLRPAMTAMSRITHVRDIYPGETTGYGRYFVAKKPMRLAVAPFGFAQGLMRSRSNRGWALIRGRRAPQIGLISMNSSTYDVTDIPDARLGDNVVLLGRNATAHILPSDLAGWCSATIYEVLTLLGRLNPRYIEGFDYEENA